MTARSQRIRAAAAMGFDTRETCWQCGQTNVLLRADTSLSKHRTRRKHRSQHTKLPYCRASHKIPEGQVIP